MNKVLKIDYEEYQNLLRTIKEQSEVIDDFKKSEEHLLYKFTSYVNRITLDGQIYKISIPVIVNTKTSEYQTEINAVIRRFEDMIETLEDVTEKKDNARLPITGKIKRNKSWIKRIFCGN